MAKQIIQNYIFDASARTLTLSDFTTVRLDGLQLITNVTDNTIIYNFAAPTLGATVSDNVITLAYDTTSMTDTDSIQIIYDSGTEVALYDEQQAQTAILEQIKTNSELLAQLSVVVKNLQQATVDPPYLDKSVNATRNQIVSGTINTVTTVSTATTVGTVTNMTNIDTYQGKLLMIGQDISAWALTVRGRIS